MVDDDVAQRADRVVEVAAVLDPELSAIVIWTLGDVVAIPDRLENGVREAQVEELVEPHLPEEVVDPVQLGLVDVLVDVGRELARRREVVSEGLLDDHPRVLVSPARSSP